MLASRGFVYWSAEKAGGFGNRYHPGDDCTPVPSWGQCHLQGYDPANLLALWKKAANATSKQQIADMRAALPVGKRNQADTRAVLESLRKMGPDAVTDWKLPQEWPSDVLIPHSADDWTHILWNHSSSSSVPGKTRFPWPDDEVKYAVELAVVSPDIPPETTNDGNRQFRTKLYKDEVVRVWLQKRRGAHGKFKLWTAYPAIGDERGKAWTAIQELRGLR